MSTKATPDMRDQHTANFTDLEMLLEMLRRAIEAGDPTADLLLRVNDLLRHTRAALSKARGEQ